jgi:hypothetical protein
VALTYQKTTGKMHIYKFRIISDENDSFFREIEIKPSSTFLDFHKAILECIGFEDEEMASFYVCDGQWNKGQEISLCDLNVTDEQDDDEDLYPRNAKKSLPPLVMSEVKLKDIIIDPHQRFIYVFDFLNMWTFYVELFKILPAAANTKYPVCTKCTGKLHRHKNNVARTPGEGDSEESLLKEFEDLLNEEDEGETEDSSPFGDSFEDNTYN